MKSLIILKGLAKTEKLKWVHDEKLENYYLDGDIVRKLYSTPELIKPTIDVLSRSQSSLVYSRFIEILLLRLCRGNLVVVDLAMESTSGIELLATIFGYQVFYKVFPIPQDYLSEPKKYNLPCYQSKKKFEVEKDVRQFLNLQFSGKEIINNYRDIVKFWRDYGILELKESDRILHISDLHSNYSLLSNIDLQTPDFCIFHGDYIDGIEVGGSKKLIRKIISDKSGKYIFLEGNHEIRLRKYLGWLSLKSTSSKTTISNQLYQTIPEDFLETTAKEFEGFSPSDAWKWLTELNNKLLTHVILKRNQTTYICTHAGIRYLEQISPKHVGSLIYGSRDMDSYDREFSQRYSDKNIISIHAHCKYPTGWNPIKYNNVVNLDPEDESEIVYIENNNNKNKFKPCLEKLRLQ